MTPRCIPIPLSRLFMLIAVMAVCFMSATATPPAVQLSLLAQAQVDTVMPPAMEGAPRRVDVPSTKPRHDTFESIALGDWMLRLAYLIAVLFTAGFATVLAFVPWLIRVRGPQRAVHQTHIAIVWTYYLFLHLLWSIRWVLFAALIVLLGLLFVYFLSAGTESMLR